MTNTNQILTPGTIGRRRAAIIPEQPPQLWKSVKPKKAYDIVIVGGGGHGLATAYYLAKNHGLTNIAVLEKAGLQEETQHAIPQSFVRITYGTNQLPYTSTH